MSKLTGLERDMMWRVVFDCLNMDCIGEHAFVNDCLEVKGIVSGSVVVDQVSMETVKTYAVNNRWFGVDPMLDDLENKLTKINADMRKKYINNENESGLMKKWMSVHKSIGKERERYWRNGYARAKKEYRKKGGNIYGPYEGRTRFL